MTEKIKNLLTRAATGVVFVAVVVGATMWSVWSFAALMAVVATGCLWEFFVLARKVNIRNFWPATPFIAIFYIVLPLVFLFWLRCLPFIGYFIGPGEPDYTWNGWEFVMVVFCVVWANDVFAYLTGMALGKHPMAPKISPKKTWEGFAGGVVGAVLVAVLMSRFVISEGEPTPINFVGAILFGIVCALGAVGGDLFESWLKRRAEVKDSGSVFPGHGGFLDRFDAVLGVGVVGAVAMVGFLIFLMCI